MLTNRWFFLAVLFAIRTTVGFQFQSVASVSGPLSDDLGLNHSQIGTLIGLAMLPGVVLAFPVGLMINRYDNKRFLGAGLALLVVGSVLMALASSFPAAIVARTVVGIGSVMMIVTITKVAADKFDGKEIKTAMAIMLSSWPFGIAIGLVSQDAIASATSWQTVMFISSGANAVALVSLIFLIRPTPSIADTSSVVLRRFTIPARELLMICLVGLAWGMFNTGFAIHFSFTPDLLSEDGWSTTEAAALISVGVWITMVSIPLGGYVVERVGHSGGIVVISTLLTAAAVGLFPFVSIPLALSVAFGLALGPPPGPIIALTSEAVSAENRGIGLGVFYTWFYALMAIGPIVAGFSRDISDSAETPVIIAALAIVLVVPFLGAFRIVHSRTPRI